MTTYKFNLPVSEAEVRKLTANDIVYVSGIMVTARDQAHQRALDLAKNGKPLPVTLEGCAIFHCGPVMRKKGDEWIAVAAGPTTSTRMEIYEEKILEKFKPRIIIGKGGMGKRTTEAMSKYGAVYCAFTGGAAVLAAKTIRHVLGVKWLDLGMPEAMWILEVESFGPLVVAIDSFGKNLFDENLEKVKVNKQIIYDKFGL